MPSKQNLFGEAGRSLELLVGWVCALISLIFGGLLAVCIYLVAWRNPREFGVHELFEVKTLVIFSFFLVIAVSFSVFASRLLSKRGPGQRLMSANVLRAWGAFFAGTTIFILMNAIVNRKWAELPQLWYALSASLSMGVAAFSLARSWARKDRIDSPR